MTNRKLLYTIVCLCIVCFFNGIICFGTVFYVFKSTSNFKDTLKNNENIYLSSIDNSKSNNDLEQELINEDKNNIIESKEENKEENNSKMVISDNKINESTKMIYQYYYKNDGMMEENEEIPPYFLLGFDFNDMLEYYPDWQIISFSDKEVVMRKIVEEDKEKSFIVTQKDGYIAVYYQNEDEGNSLYEITGTPVSTLTHDEQVRLNDGIIVKGEYELAKILAEYNS